MRYELDKQSDIVAAARYITPAVAEGAKKVLKSIDGTDIGSMATKW